MSLGLARAWWDAVREQPCATRLSPANLAADLAAVDASLTALADARAHVLACGAPPTRFGLAAASTVPTAPIEWVAVALAVGAEVTLKRPRAEPGLLPTMVDAAQRVGAPLRLVDTLEEVGACESAVLLGSDASAAAWVAGSEGVRRLAFGHRVAAVCVAGEPTAEAAYAIAADLAAADTRGCMSPIAIFLDGPEEAWAEALSAAMRQLEAERPRGAITDAEAVALRTKIAMGRAVGRAIDGGRWSVLILPARHTPRHALPRQAVVVPWREEAGPPPVHGLGALAVLGTTFGLRSPRVTALGELQRPPLLRHHDGFDHLGWLGQAESAPARIAVVATDVDTRG
jgi:hypothetical protein